MGIKLDEQSYRDNWDEVADLDAWKSYEYWSRQLEAEMDWIDEAARADHFVLIQPQQKEAVGDVSLF